MSSKIKKTLVTIAVLGAIGFSVAYYMWNKPHKSAKGTDGVKTEAAALHKAYTADSSAAKKMFTEQVVEVAGMAAKVSKNQQGQDIILLKTATDGAFINCTMDEPARNIKEGASVVIKGICNGIGQGDADLGIPGDVYLGGCYLVK